MRWLVSLLAALAFAPAAAAATPKPCALVTVNDASTVLHATASKGKPRVMRPYDVCVFSAGKKSLTVKIRAVANKADFEKSAQKSAPPVFPFPGVDESAYSAGGGTVLLVWKDGVEIVFSFTGASPVIQTQKDLATAVVARLNH